MLADFKVERREFDLKGGSFAVEGLSFESFTTLIHTHLPDLEALFDLFENVEALSMGDVEKLAHTVLSEAPGFAANVIALAAGEPDAVKVAAKMPFPLQVEILVAIGDLTFSEVGGVKKFLPTVASLMGVTGVTEKVMTAVATRKKAR